MGFIWLQGRLEVFLKELESERQLKIDEVIMYNVCGGNIAGTHVTVPTRPPFPWLTLYTQVPPSSLPWLSLIHTSPSPLSRSSLIHTTPHSHSFL